jgi:enhancer of polycomb-like protein
MVQKREQYKRTAFTADKELWEAKWKFYETKRKWPSLGVSREEEEFITGRSHQQQQARAAENAASMNGAHAIQMQSANTPVVRKKQPDREKEERDRRERMVEMARAAEKGVAGTGRSMAPEHYKERLQALRQKLEDAIARRAAANADWDDLTDVSVIRWIIWVFH